MIKSITVSDDGATVATATGVNSVTASVPAPVAATVQHSSGSQLETG